MDYKIANGRCLLMTATGEWTVEPQDLYIRDGRLLRLGGKPPEGPFETVDASDKLILPGLINMHTHAYMSILKNTADDVPFDEWLFRRIMPVEDSLSPEDAYWSAQLACMEMIRTGTTCFTDMHMFKGQSCKASQEAGLRAFIGRGLVGEDLYEDGYSRFREAVEESEQFAHDLTRFVFSPHALYSCSENLLSQVSAEAEQRGWLKQIHLSESDFEVEESLKKYGRTPVQVLDDVGFLDEKTIVAHGVKLTERDMECLASRRVTVVTNPASNAKLGNGIAPVPAMWEKGINLCLGTDSTASNNTLNLFREMGLLSLIHKGVTENPTTLTATQVLKMVTTNAAAALGMSGKLGTIAEGACADLIFLDLNAPSLLPNHQLISALCYAADGSEVSSVMVNGQFILKDGVFLTMDTERVRFEAARMVRKYWN